MSLKANSVVCVIGMCLGLAIVPAALAQPAPSAAANPERDALLAIKTWAVRGEPGQVVYTSPAKAGTPSMTIILPLIQALSGQSLDDHFKAAAKTYITRFSAGRAEKRQGVAARQLSSGRVLTDTVVFKSPSDTGGEVLILTGWDTAGGAQVVAERIPHQMAADDLAVKQSSDYVAVLARRRFGLTAEKLELQTKNNR